MTTQIGRTLAGVDPVVGLVVARLEGAVPDELDRLEVAHGRPAPAPVDAAAEGPDLWRHPQLYARSDRAILEPDDYPAILVVPQGTGPATAIDVVDGAVEWRVPYLLRVFGFCRHWGPDQVAACRNRLAVATLSALLRAPRLADGVAVDLSGWRQSFSDVGVDDVDQSTVAGWWLEFTVNADEAVTLDAPGHVEIVTVTAHPEAD